MARLLALSAAAHVCVWVAFVHWDEYPVSRRWVLVGWLLVFLGPMVLSVFPLRMFVDWSAMEPGVSDYRDEFRAAFNIDAADEAITKVCAMATDAADDQRGGLSIAIEQVCNTIAEQLPRGLHVFYAYEADVGCSFFRTTFSKTFVDQSYDFAPVHQACDRARETSATESDVDVMAKVLEACSAYSDLVASQPGGSGGELMASAERWIDHVGAAAEMVLGLGNGLITFKALLPAALSVSPALLRGCVKVKTLVPHAAIPGTFIVLLPWLYTPLVWCLYNVAFQLVGNPVVLFGLFFLAFGPMVNVITGHVFQISLPVTKEAMRKWLRWNAVHSNIVKAVAVASLGWWLLSVESEDLRNRAVENVRSLDIGDLSATSLVSMLAATIAKFFFTSIAATDWMVGEIREQHVFSRVMSGEGGTGAKLRMRMFRALAGESEEGEGGEIRAMQH